MRLIDADAMKSKLVGSRFHYIRNFLNKQPTIEAEPVRHGRWVEHIDPLPWCEDDVDVFWKCSVCETPNFAIPPYCPNCGAKMDGDKHDTQG